LADAAAQNRFEDISVKVVKVFVGVRPSFCYHLGDVAYSRREAELNYGQFYACPNLIFAIAEIVVAWMSQ
jgi:hypothetical protein